MRFAKLVVLVAIPVACSSSSTNEAASGGAGGTGGSAGASGSGGAVSGGGGSAGSGGDAGVDAGCGGFAQRFGGPGAEVKTSYMVTDGTGAILVGGQFKGQVDFGGGPLTSPSNSSYDGFLLKLDASGKYLWAKQFADSSSTNIKKVRVASDSQNNVYLSFEFSSAVKIAGAALQSGGGVDIAVAKLSSTGDLQWAKRYGGTLDESGGVVPHSDGTWSLQGQFMSAELDFGGATSTKLTKANTSNADAFAAGFDAAGAVAWSRKYGGLGNQTVYGLGAAFPSDGATAFMASFAGDINFGSPANCPQLLGSGSAIAKLSSSGTCMYQVHAKPAVEGGTGSLALWYARATASNGLVVAGAVFGSVELLSGGTSTSLVSHGDADLALVRLDTTGSVTQALAFGDALYQEIGGLAVDGDGNVLLAGYSATGIDFGDAAPLAPVGAEDIYVAKLDPSGKLLWNARFGDEASQAVSSLAVGPDGRTVLAGTFAGAIDFGLGAASVVTAVGTRDLYVAKLCK